jgi:5'-nucleotidase / UDP-sugar diphosphatase
METPVHHECGFFERSGKMKARSIIIVLLVLLFATASSAVDTSPLRAAIEARLLFIQTPPQAGYEKEHGRLVDALEALTAYEAGLPEIDRGSLRHAIKRAAKSGTADPAIPVAIDGVLEELCAYAERCVLAAEAECWILQAGKERRQDERDSEKARGYLKSGRGRLDDDRYSSAVSKLSQCLKRAWAACPPLPDGTITFIHVSDSHGHLDRFGPRKKKDLIGRLGGMSRLATILGQSRAISDDVLITHGGDFFTGSFFHNEFFGIPELQMLALLGLDAMAVGNHEFDFGPEVLAWMLSESLPGMEFPLLAANVDVTGYPALGNWIGASTVKVIDGKTVAIFGLATPDDPVSTPAPVVIDDDVVTMAYVQAETLRAQGADIVICLSHLGLLYDQAIAENVPGIDVILGGHSHDLLTEPLTIEGPAGGETIIIHVGESYQHVGRLRIVLEGGSVRLVDHDLFVVDHRVPVVDGIQATVDGLRDAIEAKHGAVFSEIIARAKRTIDAKWDPTRPERDTSLGNLVTDAFRAKTGTDLAIAALGFLRDPLYEGSIVAADVFGVVSYGYHEATGLGFQLATVDITGLDLIKGIEAGLAYYGLNNDFFLQVSGMSYSFDPTRGIGERILLETVRIGGQPIDPAATYSLTVNSGIVMLLPTLGVEVSNVVILENDFEYTVLRDHVESLGKLDVRSEGRILEVQ